MTKAAVIAIATLLGASVFSPAKAYDIQYAGSYRVTAAKINCHTGPGYHHQIKTSYAQGQTVQSSYVAFNQANETWLFTDRNCFVRGASESLNYQGYGEDPSTMCDRRTESC